MGNHQQLYRINKKKGTDKKKKKKNEKQLNRITIQRSSRQPNCKATAYRLHAKMKSEEHHHQC